jgi:YVTN family beta-propeller protein
MFNIYASIESVTLNIMVVTYVTGMLVTLLILSSLISNGIFTTIINIRSIIMQNAYASDRHTNELSIKDIIFMKTGYNTTTVRVIFGVQNPYLLSAALSSTGANSSTVNSSLSLVQSIPLPNVTGRIDHLGVDKNGDRLFVAELGNNSVDIIDLRGGKRINSVTTGLNEPQGIAFVPDLNKLFVANRADGSVNIFDGKTFTLLQTIKLNGDADNIRYDSNNGLVYVGYGNGGLAVINASSGEKLGNIQFPGHPESFQLEKFGNKVFVNVPDDDSIVVADKKNLKVTSKWTLTSATENFPMALDEGNHRLFVGFRDPAKVIVYDTESGREVASFNTAKDVDDIFYDAANKQIYISGGEGAIDIFKQRDADHYDLVNKIQSAQGARTSLFVPELNRLYLAVPEHRGQEAQIQVYEVG